MRKNLASVTVYHLRNKDFIVTFDRKYLNAENIESIRDI